MLFAQISDTHIAAPGEKPHGVAPVGENLARAVAFLNRLDPRPDFVLLTGDVTDTGALPQARHAARLLEDLEMPCHIVPGNHDDRKALASAFPQEVVGQSPGGFLNQAFDAGPLRFIGLDSTTPGQPGGAFCERRAAWLKDALAERPDAPTVLFLHHPPQKFGVAETDVDGFAGADRLARIVADNRQILRVLCGHIHLFAHGALAGVPVTCAPAASGMRLALDLTRQAPSAFHLDDPALLLHKWTDEAGLVTHHLYARGDEPAHLFQ